MKKFFKPTLHAFSLLELSIVLVIMGVLAGGVLKGKAILDNAKIQGIATDFQRYKLMISEYKESYHALPGDDPNATNHFSDTQNGNGDGIISDNDVNLFWTHLFKAGIINTNCAPSSKIGGYFNPVHSPNSELLGHWMILGSGPASKLGLLTPKQAKFLKSKVEDDILSPTDGDLRFKEGEGQSAGQCVQDNKFNLEIDSPTCVAYMRFD